MDNILIPEIPHYMMNGCKISDLDSAGVEIIGGSASKKKKKTAKKKKLPKKVSIKAKFPEVYEQNCGCCTTCAALGCDDYYYHGAGKPWRPSFKFTYFIQRSKIEKAKDLTKDDGSIVLFALRAIKKYGACSAKVWDNNNPIDKVPSKEAYANGLKGKEITTYYAINNFAELKEALSLKRPVACSMRWCKYTYNEEFILDSFTYEEFKANPGAHAIVVVGYDDDKKLIEIRNSWGSHWGNNGYIYIRYEDFKKNIYYTDSYAVAR